MRRTTGRPTSWTVKIWWGSAGEIAQGTVVDATGYVVEAWTGPQVAWGMARGSPGRVRRHEDQQPVALGRVLPRVPDRARRPAPAVLAPQPRSRDAALADGVALVLQPRRRLHRGAAVLSGARVGGAARTWIGVGPAAASHAAWPVWVLLGATIFLAGFRVGLNIETLERHRRRLLGRDRRGAHRARAGAVGELPVEDDAERKSLRAGRLVRRDPQPDPDERALREREPARRHLRAGRVRVVHPRLLLFGWSGKWDDLPAAHFTSIAFDLLCMLGLWLVGRRFGGRGSAPRSRSRGRRIRSRSTRRARTRTTRSCRAS